jgi:hypothetical protein
MIHVSNPFLRRTNRTDEDDESRHKEKKRKVTTSAQYAPFKLLENENFYNTFTGRKIVKSCPCVGNKTMCRRWNILGRCYNTCNMKETHVPESQLSQQQKSDFGAWMTNCRQAAGSAWRTGPGPSGAWLPPKPSDSFPTKPSIPKPDTWPDIPLKSESQPNQLIPKAEQHNKPKRVSFSSIVKVKSFNDMMMLTSRKANLNQKSPYSPPRQLIVI